MKRKPANDWWVQKPPKIEQNQDSISSKRDSIRRNMEFSVDGYVIYNSPKVARDRKPFSKAVLTKVSCLCATDWCEACHGLGIYVVRQYLDEPPLRAPELQAFLSGKRDQNYCKSVCPTGSENGTCPCKNPKQCPRLNVHFP